MNAQERQVIDGLFDRLREVERQSAPREPLAEAHIRARVDAQPGATYYMAQVVLVQEQALKTAQARIEELEHELANRPAAGGGFLSTLFGGQPQAAPQPRPGSFTGGRSATMPAAPPPAGPWGPASPGTAGPGMLGAQPGRGGGFLAGAAQTAMGVVGGMVLGNMLMSAFGGGQAKAAEAPAPQPAAAEHHEQVADAHHDSGDDYGSDFGSDT